jgi:type I restriction enzyme R subunit
MKHDFLLEKPFQNEIFRYLISHGYQVNRKEDYNYDYALDTSKLFAFIKDSQKEEWEKFSEYYGEEAEKVFLKKLNDKINARRLVKNRYTGGLLNALKNPIDDIRTGASIRIAYLSQSSNEKFSTVDELYDKNILSVSYEFEYEDITKTKKEQSNRVDLAIFLNGIPIIMIELKKNTAGQTARFQGTNQYKYSRDPENLIFRYNKRSLVYFALDEYEAYVTTELNKKDSFFLPFNMGREDGSSGNPVAPQGKHQTYYVWEHVLDKKMLLKILDEFIFEEVNAETKKPQIIFPRFHQLDAVVECEKDFDNNGIGGRYIIWHSAGSGKTNTIALLAFRLLAKPQINTVIIISDRTVIDGQLRDKLIAVDNGETRVKWAESDSSELLRYINSGNMIVGTTLQKFPFILEHLVNRKAKGYAIIIDEAHSSTAGMTMSKVSETFTGKTLKEAIELDEKADIQEDEQEIIIKQANKIKLTNQVSYYAFTATPKKETQELFGTRNQRGKECFHKYTMRQAIEEGFILNPLQCYKNMRMHYDIDKKKDSDEEYDSQKSKRKIFHYISSDDGVIRQKSQEILNDFCSIRIHWLEGKSKGMIVTPSRLHALKYKVIIDKLIKEQSLPIKTAVAFTGKVKHEGMLLSENDMNSQFKEKDIKQLIKNNPDVRLIIVADKLQTGFDEPLLCCMYVDKRFNSAVKAVQTLSRINRSYKGKKTFIMDFVNDSQDIKEYFEYYYNSEIWLPTENETDPDILIKMRDEIFAFGLFDADMVNSYEKYFIDKNITEIERLVSNCKYEYSKLDKERKKYFYKLGTKFIRLHYYIGMLIERWDEKMQALADFLTTLCKVLYEEEFGQVINPSEFIDLSSARLKVKEEEHEIPLDTTEVKLPKETEEVIIKEKKYALLDEIIETLNALLSEEEAEDFYDMADNVMHDNDIINKVKANDFKAASAVVEDKLTEFILNKLEDSENGENEFYTKLFNRQDLMTLLAKNIINQLQGVKYAG